MARTTVVYSISLPPAMSAELEDIRRKEHRTRSELLREALRVYASTRAHLNEAPAPGPAFQGVRNLLGA